jgi:hypothetical protein
MIQYENSRGAPFDKNSWFACEFEIGMAGEWFFQRKSCVSLRTSL